MVDYLLRLPKPSPAGRGYRAVINGVTLKVQPPPVAGPHAGYRLAPRGELSLQPLVEAVRCRLCDVMISNFGFWCNGMATCWLVAQY